MQEPKNILNFVSDIEDIVTLFSSVKPVECFFVDKKTLYITLEEELYLYERKILNDKFISLIGSSDEVEFFTNDPNDFKSFLIKL